MDQLSIRLTQALSSDERLLWSGKPKIGKMFNKIDYFLLPFGAIWTFGGTLYLLMAIQVFRSESSGSIFEQVLNGMQITMMIPIILIGVYLLVIRFFVKAFIKNNMLYAVSNCRIFLVRNGLGPKIRFLEIDKIAAVEISDVRQGLGNVYFFCVDHYVKKLGFNLLELPFFYYHVRKFTFYDISGAEAVRAIIYNLQGGPDGCGD